MIGIVIPYFQRERGLLHRALQSIGAQTNPPDYRVFIVDDDSPSPVAPELENLAPDLVDKIIVYHQSNGGPGAARNLALDQIPEQVDVIAFLDSDDAWLHDHLSSIALAMSVGADFYFADYRREQSELTQFARCGYEPDGGVLEGAPSHLRWCRTDELMRAVVYRSPIGTPSVAFRRHILGDIRFRTEFRSFGEDIIFWLTALTRSPRTAASSQLEVQCGKGVNIADHGSWGDDRAVRTIVDQMKLHAYMRRHFISDREVAALSEAECRRLERDFIAGLFAMMRRTKLPPLGVVAAGFAARPTLLLRVPCVIARVVYQRLGRRSK